MQYRQRSTKGDSHSDELTGKQATILAKFIERAVSGPGRLGPLSPARVANNLRRKQMAVDRKRADGLAATQRTHHHLTTAD